MQTIRVETDSAKYDVFAGSGILETLAPRIQRAVGRLPRRIFVLTSPEIWALWSRAFLASFANAGIEPPIVLFLPPGEEHKNMKHVERLLREMIRAGGDRGSFLIAFGGGIVGDLGGFVAAIFMRGIPYVQVPTTFLAQVDSSVGGKVGVNLPEGKNLVGNFLQPRAVFADITVLGTLPDRELRAGLMESVKAGIIRDRALVRFMEENADAILRREPKALEKLVYRYGPLPKLKVSVARVLAATGSDKKNVGGVRRFVLPFGIGEAGVVEDVTAAEIEAAVKYMLVRARTVS